VRTSSRKPLAENLRRSTSVAPTANAGPQQAMSALPWNNGIGL
jgi:hypothetical protein